jgi:imidazolonepropionase-like amidohydrolase
MNAQALSRQTQLIEYTTIPILAVGLVAAFVALAALTGCFGAKAAAARAAAAAKAAGTPVKAGAYGASGPIPITVSTR